MGRPKGSKNVLPPSNEASVANKPGYIITLAIGKDIYSISAPTILEALLQIQPTSFGKGFVNVQIEHGGKTTKLPLKVYPTKLERIFALRWELELFAKRIKTLM